MITIIDAVMGTGKSTWVINKVNKSLEKKFIILTPLLSEVERYKIDISRPDIIALDDDVTGTKTANFREAVQKGKSIITTHKLFSQLYLEEFELADYELIIDETITLVEEQVINNDDFNMLVDTKKVWTEPTDIDGMFIVHPEVWGVDYQGEHRAFIDAAKGEHVFRINNTTVVFVTPPEKLSVFKNVHIMTYIFEGSETHCWLQLHKLDFEHKELRRDNGGHKLLPHDLSYSGSQYKPLITIYDDKKLNSIGEKKRKSRSNPLSRGWFKQSGKNRKKEIKQLRNHTANFFKNKMKAKGADILWTCPKDKRADLKDRYFDPAKINTWLSYDYRATNDYKDRHYLAYLLNVFPRVSISNFFKKHGITMDQERIALSTLIQWVWRSAIRVEEAITIYLPSERMRKLLQGWL